jgi:hypothetical protein
MQNTEAYTQDVACFNYELQTLRERTMTSPDRAVTRLAIFVDHVRLHAITFTEYVPDYARVQWF